VPSPVGTRHRGPAAATTPTDLLFGIQHRQGHCGSKLQQQTREMAALDVPIRGWLGTNDAHDARSATLQCSRCARGVLSDQALDRQCSAVW
jgi:hypothetical protein